MRPLLVAVQDGQTHRFNDVIESVCNYFQLTEEEMRERLPSGKQTYIKNRLAWARTYMNKAGLTAAPGRGQIQITDRGLQAIQDCPDRVDVRYLRQYPEFVEFHKVKSKPNTAIAEDRTSEVAETADDTDPQERLERAHTEIQQALASDILESIQEQTPQFFEKLVVDLMQSMGYGGWSEQSGSATQYSNDGGIDGVINEDPLGLDTIYLQAKRYSNTNIIHRPEIDTFIGALTRQGARKGVFITTSRFSKGAVEAAKGLNMSIVLIDGEQLAQLMIKHNLGVSVKQTYQLQTLDTDYFNEG
ncbi:restriction endonuclease [Amphritea balenae]|uniref:Restriction endonuclease n=2 Tax=Amphritea balenae TaxID=452629 RepID=A0A3P1T0A8_9GAMM|nr:restriction endonuclease [Amphritea balenae]